MVFSDDVISSLESGSLVVLPTDTLYGIVCSAHDKQAVEKLYRVRGRDVTKPCIILIADSSELKEFGIVLSDIDEQTLHQHWPGKVSVIFDCLGEKWQYLHRGTESLAFRVPDNEELRTLLRTTGPLLAPSANVQGGEPAHTLEEAKGYFGTEVAFYVDGGSLESLPSTVARLQNGVWETLREGAVTLTSEL